MPVAGIDGNKLCANVKFIATPWKGGGGQVLVQKADAKMKCLGNEAKLIGHTGPIQDMSFNPFQDDMLATASAD